MTEKRALCAVASVGGGFAVAVTLWPAPIPHEVAVCAGYAFGGLLLSLSDIACVLSERLKKESATDDH